jgi:hypothetical protein
LHISARPANFAQDDERNAPANFSGVEKVTSPTCVARDNDIDSDLIFSPLLFQEDEEDEEFSRAAFEVISFLGFESCPPLEVQSQESQSAVTGVK